MLIPIKLKYVIIIDYVREWWGCRGGYLGKVVVCNTVEFYPFFLYRKMRLRTLSSTPLLYPTPTPSPQIDDLIHDYISS